MSFEEYNRKTFTVTAAQVTLENIEEIAQRCGGTVDTIPTKLLGTEMNLPCIKMEWGGREARKSTATLGCYMVELNGSFRVYKPAQFFASFEKKRPNAYRNENGSNAEAKSLFQETPNEITIYESAGGDAEPTFDQLKSDV